jgi:eukaryotic-like serine/threonine-protein kinase
MASGMVAGRYRLKELLGSSLMAEVHLASDVTLERLVVVKLLAPRADRARFEREARAAAGLAHENIVQLFDYGEDEGRPYIVFEYLPGQSLRDRLAGGNALPDDETAMIARDIAAGLAHAHARGVVHRDLKPGNVLFDGEDRAKIADFGIARVVDADTITDEGTVLGTAAYISPEQVRGEPSTPASDVYAFGVVLYEMLSGRPPFAAENPTQLAAMHRDAEPPPLQSARSDAPAGLARLTTAALAKDPVSRPADGAALAAALGADAPPTIVSDAETRVLAPVAAQRRRPRLPLLVGFSLVVLLIAGVIAAVLLSSDQSSAPAVPVQSGRSSSTHTNRGASTQATTRLTSSRSTQTTTAREATTTTPRTTSGAPPADTLTLPTNETTAPLTTEPTTTSP